MNWEILNNIDSNNPEWEMSDNIPKDYDTTIVLVDSEGYEFRFCFDNGESGVKSAMLRRKIKCT